MALKSLVVRIGADTKSIDDALSKIGGSAKTLEASLAKIGDVEVGKKARQDFEHQQRLIKELNGVYEALATRAQHAAAGIEAVGGPARLTSRDLSTMNRAIQDGLEAYRALGQEAPKELQKVAAAVQKQQKDLQAKTSPAGGLLSGLNIGSLASGFAVGAGAGLFASLAKDALNYADALSKAADRTGIGVVALQRLDAIALSSGNTLDNVTGAVNQFQNRLASGEATTALNQIGLSLDQIRSLSPDDQFIAIAKGIQTIKDPAEQVRVAMELFGKSGADLLPTLKSDVDAAAKSMFVMSEESVKALDAVGDTIGDVGRSVKAFIGELAGRTITTTLRFVREVVDGKGLPPGAPDPSTFKDVFLASGGMSGFANLPGPNELTLLPKVPASPLQLPAVPGRTGNLFGGASALSDGEKLNQVLQDVTGAIAKLTPVQREAAMLAFQHGQNVAGATETLRMYWPSIDVATVALDGMFRQFTEGQTAQKNHADALDALNAKIRAASAPIDTLTDSQVLLVEQYRSWKLSTQEMALLLPVSERSIQSYITAVDTLRKSLAAIENASSGLSGGIAGFNIDRPVADLQYLERQGDFTAAALVKLGAQWSASQRDSITFAAGVVNVTDTLGALQTAGIGPLINGPMGLPRVQDESKKAAIEFDQLAQSFAQLAQVGGDSFGGITQGLSQVVAGLNTAQQSMKTLSHATNLLQGLSGALGLVTAGISIVQAVAGLFRNEEWERVNDLRDDFVGVAGGLAELNQRAFEASGSLDLVQDVLNARNVEDYTAAVERLNAALDRQSELERMADRFGPSRSQNQQNIKDAYDVLQLIQRQFDAGERTQEQVQAAYVAYQEAIAAAGGEAGKAAKAWLEANAQGPAIFNALGQELEGLIGQRDQLLKGLAAEAAEEESGVIEQRQRAELAALDAEILRKGEQYERLAQETGEAMADAISEALKNIRIEPIRVPVVVDPSTAGVPGAATGGLVTANGIQPFKDGGRVLPFLRRGTDTVPAMLTPGEIVLNAAQISNVAGALSSGSGGRPFVIQIDGREIMRGVMPYFEETLNYYGAGRR